MFGTLITLGRADAPPGGSTHQVLYIAPIAKPIIAPAETPPEGIHWKQTALIVAEIR